MVLPPDAIKALYHELIQFHKELSLLAFAVSGVQSTGCRETLSAVEMVAGTAEQTAKAVRKFNQFAAVFEKKVGVTSVPHRLLTGVPKSDVRLSADQVALLDRRLKDLERDIHEHLAPLLELSRVARTMPEQLQQRVAELATHAPHISNEVQRFSADFDQTFAIQRSA